MCCCCLCCVACLHTVGGGVESAMWTWLTHPHDAFPAACLSSMLFLQAWIESQKEFAGMDAAKRNVWIQVGGVRCM